MKIFVVLWLAVQVAVPFVQMFDLPSFKPRDARYSWGMFSRPAPAGEVALFRMDARGHRGAIPNIERYVNRFRSPGPMRVQADYLSVDEVQERFARLMKHIARQQGDGYVYVTSIRWTQNRMPEQPEQWEFIADGVD